MRLISSWIFPVSANCVFLEIFEIFNSFFIKYTYKASYTYEKSGSQNVKATTAGAERVKVSLAFTATSDGRKLPILIILPRKRALKSPFVCPSNVVILYKPSDSI